MNYRSQRKNKFILWCIMAVAVTALALSMVLVAKALESNEGYRTINVLETGGTVSVVKDGTEYKAYSGMLLQEGHELVVAGNSYARLVLDDDKYIKVESGSRVIFETLGILGSGKTGIRLERGALTAEIINPLTEGEAFVVNTPNAVLAVRGTFFRVDLTMDKKGEVLANVKTYGGKVATKRVFPSGETEEEETLVEAGYKTAINMDATDTVYVVQKAEENENGEASEEEIVVPIHREEISDDDLVDIYFAAENGHELFVTVEEVKEDIDSREIDLEDKVSVYQLAEEALKQESVAINAGGAGAIVLDQIAFADDSKPLAVVAEDKATIGDVTMGQAATEEPTLQQMATLTDGLGGTVVSVHVHREVTTTLDPTCTKSGVTVVSCGECGEIISETSIPAIGHSEKIALTEATCEQAGSRVSTCEICGEELSNISLATLGHTMQTQVIEATCEEDGYSIGTCSVCGVVERQDGAKATGHTKVTESRGASCTSDGFEKTYCSTCGKVLSETSVAATGHTEVTEGEEATCTTDGYEKTSCSVCGEVLAENIIPAGHVPEFVGTMNFHSECSVCGIPLVTTHSYEEEITEEPGCLRVGEKTYRCECGYSYTEEIPANGHDWQVVFDVPDDMSSGCKYDYCAGCMTADNVVAIYGINAVNFPDENFRAYVEATYNTDGETGLTDAELQTTVSMEIPNSVMATNLKGIKLFSNLVALTVKSTSVQEIDVSSMSSFGSITVSDAYGLLSLNCANTNVSTLDVASCGGLETLNCANTPLTTLALGSPINLQTLDCSNTSVSSLDLSMARSLLTLNCANTNVSALDVASCGGLETLNCANTQITSLDLSAADGLTRLDISGCTGITSLNLSNTDVTTLALSNSNEYENKLSEFTQLQEINVKNSMLSNLNVSGLTNLQTIEASNCTNMYSLSAESCSSLTTVEASNSSLSTAYFNDCENLTSLNLAYNTLLGRLQLMNCTGLVTASVNGPTADITECGRTCLDGQLIITVTGTEIANEYLAVFGETYAAGSVYQGFAP